MAPHAAALLMLPLGALGAAPRFSWDTLPVFYHSSFMDGVPNATAVATIAKYPLVTIEKFQGPLRSAAFHTGEIHEEDNVIAMAKAIHAVDPAVAVLGYLHLYDYPWYSYYWDVEANPTWWSKTTGEVVQLNCSDGSSDTDTYPPRCPKLTVPMRDWSNPAAQAAYVSACTRYTAAGIDGCFIDGTDDLSAVAAGAGKALAAMQVAVAPGVVVVNGRAAAKGTFYPATKGAMIEQFIGGEESLKSMQAVAGTGMLLEAHSKNCPPMELDVACFLLAAGEGSYFGCGPWYESPTAWPTGQGRPIGTGPHWFPEFYDKPLGAPTGPAVATGKVYKRAFASGTTVTVDFTTSPGVATINWATNATSK